MQFQRVQVWTARPADRPWSDLELEHLLDANERGQAARLRFEADRLAYVAAHALRRVALATAMETDPAGLRFGADRNGRPFLVDPPDDPPAFSLTRSRELVACALCRGGRVGVDVEVIRPRPDPALLAPFVAPLHPVTSADFYLQWTALEAFWKARGLGLSAAHPRIGLRPADRSDRFEVLYAEPSRPTGLVVIRLPAPPGIALSVACDAAAAVEMVPRSAVGAECMGS